MFEDISHRLTPGERQAIDSNPWFASLSRSLRHDILRRARVKRYRDGELIASQGDAPSEWIACAQGAIRVSTTLATGKSVTLMYSEPGAWLGDDGIFDDQRRIHDTHAHGETTVLCVSAMDLRSILTQHTELYESLLRLQAQRIRDLFGWVTDRNALCLRARLAKVLVNLARTYGVPSDTEPQHTRIGLRLVQGELAKLLGASRQRINQELKSMERENNIGIRAGGLIVKNTAALTRLVGHVERLPGSPAW